MSGQSVSSSLRRAFPPVADPQERPLFLGHQEWFDAFLERTGLPPEEAPIYVRLPYQMGQDLVMDYRRDRVIEEVVKGPSPERVARSSRNGTRSRRPSCARTTAW